MKWTTRNTTFEFPRPTLIMGIINVTPDSFSDGGVCFNAQAALDRARQLVGQGADILDIGGESSRPFAEIVTEAEELRRVIPIIRQITQELAVPVSIDTQKPGVARAALESGACIVNDIAANRSDETLWRHVAETGAGYVAMHMQGTPQTMQVNPHYENVIQEVMSFFDDRMERLRAAGVQDEQVALDVGIGFGKTLDHNLELLAALKHFTRKGRPLLLGVSRKSFISRLLNVEMDARMPGALSASVWAVLNGVRILRTHDVAETLQAVRMAEAIAMRVKE